MTRPVICLLIAILLLGAILPLSTQAQDFLTPVMEFFGFKKKDARKAKNAEHDDKNWRKNPQVQQMVQQALPGLRTIFAGELTFVKNCCQPDEGQMRRMKELARAELELLEETTARAWAQQMGLLGNRRRIPDADVTTALGDAVARIVNDVFPGDAAKQYHEEHKRREEFKAQSGAFALVAFLDRDYYFEVEQREALSASLAEVWKDDWSYYLQVMPHNPQFFPPVPEDSVIPHLKKHQVKFWRSKKRQHLGRNWNATMNLGVFGQQVQAGEEWFGDVDGAQDGQVWVAHGLQQDEEEKDADEDDEDADEENNQERNDEEE